MNVFNVSHCAAGGDHLFQVYHYRHRIHSQSKLIKCKWPFFVQTRSHFPSDCLFSKSTNDFFFFDSEAITEHQRRPEQFVFLNFFFCCQQKNSLTQLTENQVAQNKSLC